MKPTQFVLQAQKLFFPALVLSLSLFTWTAAHAQITPLGDSYINTADPTKNYGAATLLDVDGTSQTTYIQFNLASIPSTASVSQATLKLYVNSVPTAGSFNVNYVNGSWTESTIDANNAPGLGATIASNVEVTTADKNQYILVNVTSAVQAWLDGSEKNNGIALVANSSFNATFDSKENTSTSHPAELDIAFAGGDGTITGITTASGSGQTGGGTSGTLNLSLDNACKTDQILQWNGSAWACSSAGTGTITGVTAGTDLTGGGSGGNVTLNLNTTEVPLLASANLFTNNQAISATASTWGLTVSQPSYQTILEQGPESGVGTALEMQTTGTGGLFWQILNTGAASAQGANKLNFRNDSAGLDVLTLTASGSVGIGTNSPTGTLDVQGNVTQAPTAGGLVKAAFYFSPFNGGGFDQCYNSTLSGSASTTPPCGFTFQIEGTGDYIINLGFQIDNRVLSATVTSWGETVGACTEAFSSNCNDPAFLTPDNVELTVYYPGQGEYVDDKVYLVVY